MIKPAPIKSIKDYYGPVSGILRIDGFPQVPQSWFVQNQMADSSGASRWFTLAVYKNKKVAETVSSRWENRPGTFEMVDPQTGERTPLEEQPVQLYRVVSLIELLEEGPEAIYNVFLSLCTSDHEWLISTELGSDNKIALAKGKPDA